MVTASRWFHAGLFVAAYLVSLGYLWSTHRDAINVSDITQWWSNRQPPSAVTSQTASASAVLPAATAASVPGTPGVAAPSGEQTGPVTPLEAVTNDLSEETRREVTAISTQASSAPDPGERAKALVKLRNAARTEESVQALISVLSADQSAQNRLFAIAALLNMARQDDETGVIKAALNRASNDADARVAARASQALASLSGVADTRQ